MKLHHLVIATKDLEKAENFLKYSHTVLTKKGPIWDPNLKANLCLYEVIEWVQI